MQRLEGHVIIVTGAAGGIGEATARRLVDEGAAVVLADRDEQGLTAVAQSLPSGRVAALAGDVSDEAWHRELVALATSRFGRLDGFFANAGMEGRVAPLAAVEIADLDRILAVNVRSVVLAVKTASEALIASGRGSLVVTSSVAGLIGSPGLGPYVATKHAVLGLVKVAALELGPQGVRVNAISPGPIDNRMMRSIEEQAAPGAAAAVKAGFEKMVALGRYGKNEEIAAAAAFLLSADAGYCNGTTIVCDGGFVAT